MYHSYYSHFPKAILDVHGYEFLVHWLAQEHMMMSIFIAEGGGRACIKLAKIQNRPNLPCVLKIEHTFAQVCSSTIYDLTMQY